MRLKRVYESAEEDGLPLEQVAIERFGSLDAFEEAKEERRILDERQGKSSSNSGNDARGRGTERPTQYSKDGGGRGLMFTDIGGSGSSSRSSSFRRPGGMADRGSAPSTPSPASGPAVPASGRALANRRLDSLRLPSQVNSPLAQSHTPIPSVMTPPPPVYKTGAGGEGKALTTSELNKMQAKVIRAKLMGAPDAAKLEAEYEAAARNAQGTISADGGTRTKVEVLPTLDAQGRMYDVGHGAKDEDILPGNRKKKEKHVRRTMKLLCVFGGRAY